MRRSSVVLYNPRAPFFTMPLALLAVGSALDRSRYDVTIVDGRRESDPIAGVLHATGEALCLGVSVLTGVPIRDALAVTRAVRARHPRCRIVWGGWHPSLFPHDTRREAGVDAVVAGRGEDASVESPWVDAEKRALVDRFSFNQGIGWGRPAPWRAPLQALVRWRCRRDVYDFPIEKATVEWVRQVGA